MSDSNRFYLLEVSPNANGSGVLYIWQIIANQETLRSLTGGKLALVSEQSVWKIVKKEIKEAI